MKNENAAFIHEISIVVPVFNAEKYLRACIESVLAQTFGNFELILVDDGSTDRSREICEKFAEQDSRLRIFSRKNAGASAARKFGVEKARAEWICFVDADDELLPDALATLVSAREKFDDEIDLIEGGHFRFWENPATGTRENLPIWGDADAIRARGNVVADGIEYGKEVASHRYFFSTTPWGKIIRKKLFSETAALDLPAELIHGEDTIMCLRLAKKIRKAARIQTPLYLYRANPDGACLHPRNRERYTTPAYNVMWWNLTKNSFAGMGEEWQEVWKIFVADTFAGAFLSSKNFKLNAPEIRPFVRVLRERKNLLKMSAKICLLETQFPFVLIPDGIFKLMFRSANFAFRAANFALRRVKTLRARKKS